MDSQSADQQRRGAFQTGVIHSAQQALEHERAFWSRLTGDQRIEALWEMVETYQAMGGTGGAACRLDRTASGVRRR